MVTDDDRARASAMYGAWFGGDEMDDEIVGDIAAALAAERDKARAEIGQYLPESRGDEVNQVSKRLMSELKFAVNRLRTKVCRALGHDLGHTYQDVEHWGEGGTDTTRTLCRTCEKSRAVGSLSE